MKREKLHKVLQASILPAVDYNSGYISYKFHFNPPTCLILLPTVGIEKRAANTSFIYWRIVPPSVFAEH